MSAMMFVKGILMGTVKSFCNRVIFVIVFIIANPIYFLNINKCYSAIDRDTKLSVTLDQSKRIIDASKALSSIFHNQQVQNNNELQAFQRLQSEDKIEEYLKNATQEKNKRYHEILKEVEKDNTFKQTKENTIFYIAGLVSITLLAINTYINIRNHNKNHNCKHCGK